MTMNLRWVMTMKIRITSKMIKKTSVADKMGKAATMSPDINLSLCSTLIIEN